MFYDHIQPVSISHQRWVFISYDHLVLIRMTYSYKCNDLKVIISMTYGHILYDHKVSNYFWVIYSQFFFKDITSVTIFVEYNGQWDEYNIYIDSESMCILVSMGAPYVGLLEILFETLELNLGIFDIISLMFWP